MGPQNNHYASGYRMLILPERSLYPVETYTVIPITKDRCELDLTIDFKLTGDF